MKTWTLLVLVLLLGVAPAASAGTPAATTTTCSDQSLEAIFAANQASSSNGLFIAQLAADKPVCQVICATSPCQSNSECTAAPNGHCRFACPDQGCCVYPQ